MCSRVDVRFWKANNKKERKRLKECVCQAQKYEVKSWGGRPKFYRERLIFTKVEKEAFSFRKNKHIRVFVRSPQLSKESFTHAVWIVHCNICMVLRFAEDGTGCVTLTDMLFMTKFWLLWSLWPCIFILENANPVLYWKSLEKWRHSWSKRYFSTG